MSNNPYAPPSAHVADVQPSSVAQAAPAFFAVSLTKLAVLSLCSFGVYEVYWFYKNWRFIQAREQSDIVPILRAFFALLFCYSCFSRIRDHGATLGVAPPLAAGTYAAGWIITSLAWKLPDPYWLITLLGNVFLLPVQAYVNRINKAAAPEHDPNARFSAWNWVTAVVGGCVLVLGIVGTLMPQPAIVGTPVPQPVR